MSQEQLGLVNLARLLAREFREAVSEHSQARVRWTLRVRARMRPRQRRRLGFASQQQNDFSLCRRLKKTFCLQQQQQKWHKLQ
jgi:hypothetical protein